MITAAASVEEYWRKEREQELLDDDKVGSDCLVKIERIRIGDALTPGRDPLGLEPEEQGVLDRPGVGADPERRDERKADDDRFDRLDRSDLLLRSHRHDSCAGTGIPSAEQIAATRSFLANSRAEAQKAAQQA